MLLSMTGHGEATSQTAGLSVATEVRTVNNRYLKVQVRTNGPSSWEASLEALVRETIRRGTVYVSVRLDKEPSPEQFRLNDGVLLGYTQQLKKLFESLQPPVPQEQLPWGALLGLPGVVREQQNTSDADEQWPLVEQATRQALVALEKMRQEEGAAMKQDMTSNCQLIAGELSEIEKRAPNVIEGYRLRLEDRLNGWLQEHQVVVQSSELVREIGIFADRADISEEIVRLRSHLEQMTSTLNAKESNGRKLDFLVQEMFREVNTIGSKGNDVEISRRVVDMKTIIERLREMVQNVE